MTNSLKTRVVYKSASEKTERLILNPPYTVFGHSSLQPSFSLVMKVGGLKEMNK